MAKSHTMIPHHTTIDAGAALDRILEGVPSRNAFRLNRCFHVVVPPGWGEVEPMFIDDLHFVFVVGGRGWYGIDGRKEVLEPGKIVFLGRGMSRSSGQDPDDPPCIIPVRFDVHDRAAGAPRPLDLPPFGFSLFPEDRVRFQCLFEDLYRYYTRNDAAVCGSILHHITAALREELRASDQRQPSDRQIEALRSFLDQRPAARLSLDEMAARAGLSRNYFARRFTQLTGLSPGQYAIHARIRMARFLLESGSRRVKEVAAALGYPNPYAFSRQFKQVTGVAPGKV